MIKPDWNIFRAKFSGKESDFFEWLCYLLFCKEFNRPKGILRFINQAGIETEPIKVNGRNIGWQAKFSEKNLSQSKRILIEAIDTTKRRYPEINKIIFYAHQDFGQGKSSSDSECKKEIESHAQKKGIEIEWRTESFFESPFVCEENKNIAQHFFTLDKSIFHLLKELSWRTKNILNSIDSEIKFKNHKIKIDRKKVLEEMRSVLDQSKIAVLTGEAGAGKTAVIKDFYKIIQNKHPFFIFKAAEFNNISHINQLFKHSGDFSFLDFIEHHRQIDEKYIVIDSVEKLSDIENTAPFQEFLFSLVEDRWKIILTTRSSYFNDLIHGPLDIRGAQYFPLPIKELKSEKLSELAKECNFSIPEDQNFLNLLQTLFYLREYLKVYHEIDLNAGYLGFKEIIWKKRILNSSFKKNNTHLKREECFLKIAKKRADTGNFFVEVKSLDRSILQKLEDDEIISHNSQTGGYFITHDIYEDLALDKIIERCFFNKTDYEGFFKNIGDSFSVRRAFRNWLSAKLNKGDLEVKRLVEYSIEDKNIEEHWRDEILISILLSDYCSIFFKNFENKLLEELEGLKTNQYKGNADLAGQGLLYKLLFWLETACKEFNESVFNIYNLPKTEMNRTDLKTVFLKPKGQGWHCMANFLNKHKKRIEWQFIDFILDLINDWSQKNQEGDTTKKAGQIALFYYDKITKEEHSEYRKYLKQIIKIILNSSYEIKKELENIFQEVISKKERSRLGRHYRLIHCALTSWMQSAKTIQNFPEQIMQLAELFWTETPKKEDLTLGSISIPTHHINRAVGIEESFGLTSEPEFKYYPASALNAPILPLLIFSYDETVDFILGFVNKSVESFKKSRFGNELEEVEVFIGEEKIIKQYISQSLWNIYRGTQTAPYPLKAIHMALERYFLKHCKDMDSKTMEKRLFYLLEKSKSSSISAVVTSIVLAYPEKTFNVAKILFQTKEFFSYDQKRQISELSPSNIPFLNPNSNFEDQICRNERLESNKLEHRKKSLESQALEYQIFRSRNVTEEEIKNRQKFLWEIFDKYYQQLSNKNDETKEDKNWRLCLARMDYRKMRPETVKINGQKFIKFNPEIDSDLKKYSEGALKPISDKNQYLLLRLWAEYKFENKEEYKKEDYLKYENNPELVIKETKRIIQKLRNIQGDFCFPFFSKKPPSLIDYERRGFEQDYREENGFRIINHSVPLYVCAVLIRDYFDKLNQEDKTFCQEAIMECSDYLIQNGNQYQSIDSADAAIKSISFLFASFPEKRSKIKSALFTLLIKGEGEFDVHAITVIVDMWEKNFEDANSLFLGYLLLKQKFDNLIMENQQFANRRKFKSTGQILKEFLKKHERDIEDIIENKLTYKKVSKEVNLQEFHLDILITAFEMLPLRIDNEDHKEFIKDIIKIFIEELFVSNKITNKYELKFKFLKNFSSFILTLKAEEIESYLKPFLDNFEQLRTPEYQEYFFSSFIYTQDKLNRYESFWIVWDLFYPKIVEMCQKNISDFDSNIIINYLLAGSLWRKDARDWHTLKEREKWFFKKASEDMGSQPIVLYSILKFLNEVGSDFIDDGIFWISGMIEKNMDLYKRADLTNSVFYMENLVRGYISRNKDKLRKDRLTRTKILVILKFLIEKGSVAAYRLREDIL